MKRFITIIPADLQKQANDYCSQFADGGELTFIIELSANGLEPVTHYISNWAMNKYEQFIMKQKYEQYMYEVEDSADTVILQQLNLQKINKTDDLLGGE